MVQFDPSIGCNERQNGIRDIINRIVENFISLAIQMPSRLDTHNAPTGDYLVEIRDQFQLFGTIQRVTNNLNEIESASKDFLDQYYPTKDNPEAEQNLAIQLDRLSSFARPGGLGSKFKNTYEKM